MSQATACAAHALAVWQAEDMSVPHFWGDAPHPGTNNIIYAASYTYLKNLYLRLHLLEEPKRGAVLIQLPCEFRFTSPDISDNFLYLLKPLAAIWTSPGHLLV